MDTLFFQQSINAISLGAIYALFALGYALVFSILGVLNLAHSAIFMWGAFIGLLAMDSDTGTPYLIAAYVVAVPLFIIWLIAFGRLYSRVNDENTAANTRGMYMLALIFVSVVLLAVTIAGFDAVYAFFAARTAGGNPVIITPLVGVVLAMFGAGLLSVVLEFAAFRPLRARNAARMAQLISSIGAALLLVNIAQLIFQQIYNRTEAYYPRDIRILPFVPTDTLEFGDLRVAPIRIVILVVALVMMVLLQYLVQRTQAGQQMRAVAFSQRIAALLGIHVSRVYVLTFFLAGALGGAAGMLYGLAFLNVTPFIGERIALTGLTAIVLGGLGSIQGAVLGGFIVAGLQTASTAAGGSSYRDAIVFILLFLVLLVRPQGLLGQPENTRA
jgi:branched-chain amino acid transport system permease protein